VQAAPDLCHLREGGGTSGKAVAREAGVIACRYGQERTIVQDQGPQEAYP